MASSEIGLRRKALGFSTPFRKFFAATLASVGSRCHGSWRYLLAFHPEEWVVRYWTVLRIPARHPPKRGSSVKAPRGCLSFDSYANVVVAQRYCQRINLVALAAVAHALKTSGERNTGETHHADDRSGFATVQLPPTAN